MCFSATASFIAGAGLCVAGITSLGIVKDRSQVPFAAIPLLFGIQQLAEGVLWLSVNGTIAEKWLWPSAFFFLIFAQVIWPCWVSFSMLIPERNSKRRYFLSGLMVIGAGLSVFHTYYLMHYPVIASASEHHIEYFREFPERPQKLISVVYIIVTILPLFVSSVKGMKMLGTAVLISLLIAFFLYREFLISTWCFFAGIVSMTVLFILYNWGKMPGTEDHSHS